MDYVAVDGNELAVGRLELLQLRVLGSEVRLRVHRGYRGRRGLVSLLVLVVFLALLRSSALASAFRGAPSRGGGSVGLAASSSCGGCRFPGRCSGGRLLVGSRWVRPIAGGGRVSGLPPPLLGPPFAWPLAPGSPAPTSIPPAPSPGVGPPPSAVAAGPSPPPPGGDVGSAATGSSSGVFPGASVPAAAGRWAVAGWGDGSGALPSGFFTAQKA